jgi:hypothetical protein
VAGSQDAANFNPKRFFSKLAPLGHAGPGAGLAANAFLHFGQEKRIMASRSKQGRS